MPGSCVGDVALARVNAVVVLSLDAIHSSADVACVVDADKRRKSIQCLRRCGIGWKAHAYERNVGDDIYRYALIRLTTAPNRAQLRDERIMPAKEMSTHTKLVNLDGKNTTGDLGSEKGGKVGHNPWLSPTTRKRCVSLIPTLAALISTFARI